MKKKIRKGEKNHKKGQTHRKKEKNEKKKEEGDTTWWGLRPWAVGQSVRHGRVRANQLPRFEYCVLALYHRRVATGTRVNLQKLWAETRTTHDLTTLALAL